MAETISQVLPAAAAPARVLIVEHDPDDIELCLRELKRSELHFEPVFAGTRAEFIEAAKTGQFDIILSDYRLPGWTGIDVLSLAQELGINTPLILVTGTLGEELAVECIKKGVSDYVLKHQLPRLSVAIRKTLEERKLREERARAEEALRDSEIHYRTLVENAPEAIVVFDADKDLYVDANHRAERLFGLSRAEIKTHSPWTLSEATQPDGRVSREAARDYLERAFKGETVNFEWTFRQSSGTQIPCEVFLSAILTASGRFIQSSIIDITERKRSDAALRDSEARYRGLFESATYGIYRAGLDGQLLEANPALVAILGFNSAEELLATGNSAKLYKHPVERERLRAELAREGKCEAIVDWIRRDGRNIQVRLVGHPAQDRRTEDGCVEVVVEEVTGRLILEKQLRQAQKFEAFGQLAGGIAHDFNNMIGAILGWAEIGLDETPADAVIHKRFEKIRLQAERAAALTRQLLAFARRQTLEPRHIHLNQVVTETLSLLEKIIGSNIEVKSDFAADLAMVRADPTQIEQVLMNLCLNARDAMPDGGRLHVETCNVEFDEEFCRRNPQAQMGKHVLLAVTDSGNGMDAATLDRIFEPFFTTKGPSKGTGLGLATVYGVVKQHGGIVLVESEIGKGTCFRIYLPVTPESGVVERQPEVGSKMRGGTETILVAEDHEGLHELARETLTNLGYKVFVAADGEEAVQLFREHADTIQLALLDVVLPKLNGTEVQSRICEMNEAIPVLFATGYSPDAALTKKIHAGAYPVLQKPYTPRDLARYIRAALDQQNLNVKVQ